MLLSNLLAKALFTCATVLAIDITTQRVDRGFIDLSIGDINIHSGAYWSIVDNALSVIAGNLNVDSGGGFFISSTNNLIGLSVTLASGLGGIKNNGVIAFNAITSLTTPNYNLIGLSFENNGEMYLGSNGSIGLPIVSLLAPSWTNTGLLVVYQQTRGKGVVNFGTPLLNIKNDGQICLHNELYQQTNSIKGKGCITAEADTTIYLATGLSAVDSTQTFYLKDSQSALRANAIALPQTYTVRGFGNGNKIGLDIPIIGIPLFPAYDYDSSSGILTLRGLSLLQQKFNIGKGYDSSKFQIVSDSAIGLDVVLLGAVQYNGPVPSGGLPTNCQPCKDFPQAPGTSATVSTTTVVTTKSDGSVCTDIEDVIISTDSSFSWFTTTSLVTEECSTKSNSQTTVTSVWTGSVTSTVTETDTPGGTDTVIVEVPSNSQTTLTSTWTGTTTKTITETDTIGGTDTVIVEVPSTANTQTTITSIWTGTTTQTITETDTPGGTDTVVVEVPSNSQTTIVSTWTGTTTKTITETDTIGGTDTVIVEVPSTANTQTTITSIWTGTTTQTITETDTVGGTDTVIVEVPSNSQTTIISTWTGTTTKTITETDTIGGTDTVIVEVPSTANTQTTITSTWTGTYTTTITETDTPGGTDTVIVEVPTSEESSCAPVTVTAGPTVTVTITPAGDLSTETHYTVTSITLTTTTTTTDHTTVPTTTVTLTETKAGLLRFFM
ncbi:Hyphally regulated cell wall protein N-terminal-domain-containing protein [Scheffersomyces xylosifermentans]|uniref:Hyphally regulated cell wall protein N-terminal-domain-containing protein n=1 Tax=Scheffersomyces xylosifermentans TaxID=1304137 RepID=UPI00315DF53B